ncbi:MAG TPA: phosphoribosyltransferase family protein [Candidatus Polarisedimenticolaceae bacterium]|nr:phosphoribosyltransferase family protein [Candidatus Polarisedimenticolaceae bacterium]
MEFKDRVEAGRKLAKALVPYKEENPVVYALPRGGVVTAGEVADFFEAPLALVFPRKISHPASPEYAIGAVTETGDPVWNQLEKSFTAKDWREQQVSLARTEAKQRRLKYQGDQPSLAIADKTALLIDDGIATGLTMIAAIQELRQYHPKQIMVAVPVAPREISHELMRYADQVIVLFTPDYFTAIGAYYQNFDQVSDEEVRQLVRAYRNAPVDEPLDLAALNALAATVKRYPVTGAQLAAQARRLKAPGNVVAFFETVPGGAVFRNKNDIMTRSEEAEILMEEGSKEPEEQLRSYD